MKNEVTIQECSHSPKPHRLGLYSPRQLAQRLLGPLTRCPLIHAGLWSFTPHSHIPDYSSFTRFPESHLSGGVPPPAPPCRKTFRVSLRPELGDLEAKCDGDKGGDHREMESP